MSGDQRDHDDWHWRHRDEGTVPADDSGHDTQLECCDCGSRPDEIGGAAHRYGCPEPAPSSPPADDRTLLDPDVLARLRVTSSNDRPFLAVRVADLRALLPIAEDAARSCADTVRVGQLEAFARAVAAVTPCSCSAQRQRAERAERERDEARAEVATVTRERDEWEANEQEQNQRAKRADAEVERLATALTDECRQLAEASARTAAAIGEDRLSLADALIKMGQAELVQRAERVEAAIARVREVTEEWRRDASEYEAGAVADAVLNALADAAGDGRG